ncbi:pyrroline-5-carboxylate reductase [Camelliibacillus cellulosilyticus]|uniref:Pyrroline-5-carboxylate reductase n=1 Tax=Camelliibacillus cellulosilyticus TaxID=2174486 RepID=A0ABV9GS52_9BACL
MEKKIGFIGCGKMATALIEGLMRSQVVHPRQVVASACTEASLYQVEKSFGIRTTLDNRHVINEADWVILAIKPGDYKSVIDEIKTLFSPQKLLISIAIGRSIGWIEQRFHQKIKIIRAMPNLATKLGEGMTALYANSQITEQEYADVREVFSSIGKVETMDKEEQMDAVVSISASSPAYVYLFIEAMADGGVRLGLPRDQAYRLASQAVLGAAKTVLESGEHPGVLKDQVSSPGGSTMAALATLEDRAFRGAVMSAMKSCTDRVKEFN